MVRYEYAGPYRSIERAEAVLEDMYATGDVFECERPAIEARRGYRDRVSGRKITVYYVTVGEVVISGGF